MNPMSAKAARTALIFICVSRFAHRTPIEPHLAVIRLDATARSVENDAKRRHRTGEHYLVLAR